MLGFAYAASWWSYQRFYAHFGIAPQDIGLTPSGGMSDIIGAIVRLGLWLALALIVLGLLPVVGISATEYVIESGAVRRSLPRVLRLLKSRSWRALGWLSHGPRKMPARRSLGRPAGGWGGWVVRWWSALKAGAWRVWIASVVSLAACGAAIAAYGWLTGWPFTGAAIGVGITSAFIWSYLSRHPVPPQLPIPASGFRSFADNRKKWALKVFDVFALVAIVGLLLVDLPEDAAGVGGCLVGKGRFAVRGIGAPVSFVHLTLLDVYAQPAVISWVGTPPLDVPQRSFKAVFLGAADGWVALYRKTRSPSLMRLPISEVVIRVDPNSDTCGQAH